MFSVFNKRIL